MRRKDREMDREFALKVIDEAEFGVLGLVDRDYIPYTLPLSIVREEDNLFFHSAKSGKKVEIIRDSDLVSLSFVSKVQVPTFVSRDVIGYALEDGSYPSIASKVFTTEFYSSHVIGKIYLVKDLDLQKKALMKICEKYTPDFLDFAGAFIDLSIDRTNIYRIEIIEISGKRKEFDEEGIEKKWMK